MSVLRFIFFAACFLSISSSVSDVFAKESRWREKDAVEAMGWNVAYGAGVTREDAERGMVEAKIFVNGNTGMTWADALIGQAVALMVNRKGLDSARDFNKLEQRDARRFFLETMRDLLKNNASGSEILDTGSVEVKAGVMEHGERKDILVPYVGIRPKDVPSHNGDDLSNDLNKDYRDAKLKAPADDCDDKSKQAQTCQ